jgi:thymidylate kinase
MRPLRSAPAGPATRPPIPFSVVLGTDYAGKSMLLNELAARGMHCVSYDRAHVPPEAALVNELRETFVGRAVREAVHSADFLVTLLQTSVVYLRDQVLRAGGDRPVVVDSYYYKILAKCRLTGLVNEQMFAWWRSFPQPRQVIFLDVDAETAWRRSGEGAQLNPFEHYGAVSTREGFLRFQEDLRRLLIEEVGAVPVDRVDGADDADRVTAVAEGVMRRGAAHV